MDGAVTFDGVLGFLILFATIVILAIIACVNLILNFVRRKNVQPGVKRSKHWLFSSLLLLAFDLIFLVGLFASASKGWAKDEAVLFDSRMLTIWIPCHLVGFFVLAAVFKLLHKRKVKINTFIDKLR